MTRRFDWAAALMIVGLVVWLAGCATRTQRVQVRTPLPVIPAIAPSRLSNLPISPTGTASLVVAQQPEVDLLVAQVEHDLEQGKSDYQNNRLTKANEEFNSAINRLMESGLDFSADSRLEPLMDQLVDTMHTYQIKIGEQGAEATSENGQAPQEQQAGQQATPEPSSPLEEIAAEANLPGNPEVDQKATAELLHIPHDLPLTVNQAVLSYLSFFQTTRGREIVEHSLTRSGLYMAMVRQVLQEEGLPLDLMYLPLCESGYQPRAVSRVGARGLWQFMPGTGRLYGLEINRWEDQRMDPVDSTRAAAQHLRDLYGIFHDWYLALAAYDSGSLTVARAIERTGYADFWQLYKLNVLPVETKNYVPIMLAMTLVAKDPTLYGIDVDPEKPLMTESFRPGRSIDLQLVADAIGVKLETLRNLNPELFGVVTPDDPTFVLRLPVGTKSQLETALASIPKSHWVGWGLHRVEEGETLESIAGKYHTPLTSLAEANNIAPGDPVAPGKVLLVPAPVPPGIIFYRVRGGDTVGRIAAHYRVSIYELRLWNHLRSNLIRVGEVLRIYVRERGARLEEVSEHERGPEPIDSGSDSPENPAYVRHSARAGRTDIVRRGDTLWSIARRYGTSVEALRAANPAVVRHGLKAGERLEIPR